MDLATFNAGLSNPASFLPQMIRSWKARYEHDAFMQIEPEFHKVNSRFHRPDKITKKPAANGGVGVDGNPLMDTTIEPVTRIALALQKLIVKRAAAFATGGDTTLSADSGTDAASEAMLKAVKDLWRNNKLRFKNGPLFKAVSSQLEAAEIWYLDGKTNEEGVTIDGKFRCRFYFPSDGWDLIPVFDNYGDLIAFGLKFTDLVTGKAMMDLYTADLLRKYVFETGQGWTERETPVPLNYGKIPVIYYQVPKSDWADVQSLIDEAEKILSVYGDAIDYNAWPILGLFADEVQLPDKGQAGKVIRFEKDADAKYLNWDTKPEAVTTMLDILMRNIYSITQTPDLNFEAMKGLGDISGVAFKRMLIDAHLKAKDAQEGWYGEGIQRRINLQMAMVKTIEPALRNLDLEITPTFSLFNIDDEREVIDNMIAANGGKPLIDQKGAIQKANLTTDAEATYQAIIDEEKRISEQPANDNQGNANQQ